MMKKPCTLLRERGVTLIELLIVVVILGLLAAVAIPQYRKQTVKARRSEGKTVLLQTAQELERYHTNSNTYAGALLHDTDPQAVGPSMLASGTYVLIFKGGEKNNTNATGYALQAHPTGILATEDATCAPLTINNFGQKGPAGCW